MTRTHPARPGVRAALLSALLSLSISACEGNLPNPATTPVIDGLAPELVSWSGALACCGEDPHPVHGAILADGAVVMVGKSGAGPEATAGFVTRWRPTDGPPEGRLVDGREDIIEATSLMSGHSALLQVAEVAGVLVAVGFEADSPGWSSSGSCACS